MSLLYRRVVRPILFTQDSERIHDRTLRTLAGLSQSASCCKAASSLFRAPPLPVTLFGLKFPNPVGLAAGMDKHAAAVPIWEAFGFGFCELGGVTWHPQPGNPAPRMFRAQADDALINRMGFNNAGAEAMADKLAYWRKTKRWPTHPVGINLGKSKVTHLDKAAEDYANSFRVLHDFADFFVVNVSSPNTPNLRQLQDKTALDEILAALQEINRVASLPPASGICQPAYLRPILIKVAPDLSFEALDEILELVGPREIAGIVATNTTIARPETDAPALQKIYAEAGGLSGRPLRNRSTEVIRHLYRQTKGSVPIIGVGGIFTAEDAWEKITVGASLVQLYTGLVYEGPSVVKEIVKGLRERFRRLGLTEWHQAVGLAHRIA